MYVVVKAHSISCPRNNKHNSGINKIRSTPSIWLDLTDVIRPTSGVTSSLSHSLSHRYSCL
uniref:Uncharacterized protein n=1 Tax=Anguilla anguilla TaxID=7936 RepID=A0A0E9UUQ0_ANGAN